MKNRVKKLIGISLALIMCAGLVAACGGSTDPTPAPTPAATPAPPPETPPVVALDRFHELLAEYGLDEDLRFIEQRTIRVIQWDRTNPGDADPADNAFSDYLKEQMLELHNVVIEEFVKVSRWSETDDLTLLLAEGSAPDVCVTYSYPTIKTFAEQGVVVDLAPYLAESGDIFPNLWSWLGGTRLYANQEMDTGSIWSIMSRMPFNQRYIPFVREDWVDALGMSLPTTIDEFEAYLYACKDNAELLLGSDAGQMIPLHMTDDPGWVAGILAQSFIPDNITDKDLYALGWGGERGWFYPGVKEAVRYLNKWFNDGLIHPDFALFSSTDDTADNLVKSGFVGAIASHSFDQPYRDGANGWNGSIQNLVGPEANFIAVNTFKNDAGVYRKLLGPDMDRNLFISSTSNEPIASLLYLDMLCREDVRYTLQLGFEGINYEVLDNGAISPLALETTDRYWMASGRNHDTAITTHSGGLSLGDLLSAELESISASMAYEGVDPRLIVICREVQADGIRTTPRISVTVTAEEGISAQELNDLGNAVFVRAIAASVADFDAVYDAEMQQLLDRYGNASIAERTQIWQDLYGDATAMPGAE